jgi:uncharacterized protein (TIGR00369 family)
VDIGDLVISSPFGQLVGVVGESVEQDRVQVRLPYRAEVTTVGDLVHGGAIASLIDVAATYVAWTGVDRTEGRRGTTIGFTVSFLAGARGQGLLATAEVVRRGRSIVVIEVAVQGDDGTQVARALVTYKLD